MAIKIELPEIYQGLLRHGAPKFLKDITSPGNLDNVAPIIIHDDKGGVLKRITIDSQLQVLERTLTEVHNNPYLYTITSKTYQRRSQLLAASILSGFNDIKLSYLHWHMLQGNFKDELRDKYNDNISILVIDGIHIDSSNNKFEKCYDLLEMYADIPRILVSSGCDPITLMKKLHLPPNRVLYFDDPLVPIQEI